MISKKNMRFIRSEAIDTENPPKEMTPAEFYAHHVKEDGTFQPPRVVVKSMKEINFAVAAIFFLWVTPELAKEMLVSLKMNEKNRPLIDGNLKRIMYCLREGLWYAEAAMNVVFSRAGELMNGQHRLYGVIRTGVPMLIPVVTGGRPAAIQYMDKAARRQNKHDVTIWDKMTGGDGKENSAMVSAMAGTMRRLIAGYHSVETNAYMIMAFYHRHDEELEWYAVHETHTTMRHSFIAGPFLLAYKTNPEKVAKFAMAFDKGTDLKEGTPLYTIRRALIEGHIPAGSKRDSEKKAAYLLRSLRLYLEGQGQDRLSTSEDDVEFFMRAQSKDSVLRSWYEELAEDFDSEG